MMAIDRIMLVKMATHMAASVASSAVVFIFSLYPFNQFHQRLIAGLKAS